MGSSLLRGLLLLALASGPVACLESAGVPFNGAGAGGEAGRDNPPSASGGNAAGDGGSLADAGSPSVPARNPNLPPPPDDTCERFHFAATACPTTEQCRQLSCDEATIRYVGFDWCHISFEGSGCLGAFDCSAAKADSAWLSSCLSTYRPCTVDTDCDPRNPYCVIDSRYKRGNCESGSSYASCRADDDCRPGSLCVAIDADGKRACSDGAAASRCNIDAECKGKRCIHEPGISVNGLNPDPKPALAGFCSTGESGSVCFTDEANCPPESSCSLGINDGKCVADARCIQVGSSTTRAGTLCSAGNVGDPCGTHSDCKSAHCHRDVNSVCVEGALGDPCRVSAECESAFCAPSSKSPASDRMVCTTGEVGASCLSPADCKSSLCEAAPDTSPYRFVCAE